MTKEVIRRVSLDEIRQMQERGELPHNTDAPEEDAVFDAAFWAGAVVEAPRKPRAVLLKLDPDVFDWFYRQSDGKGHITRMQNVLRAYMRAQAKG